MKTDIEHEMALFRYHLIAPLINGSYKDRSIAAFCQRIAEETYRLPDGTTKQYSYETFRWWYRKYLSDGFEGLYTSGRNDKGKMRSLSPEVQQVIVNKKTENFRKTATSIYNELIEEGYITKDETSLSSVLRFVGKLKGKLNISNGEDMHAFEMEHANDLWQIDTSHGPFIKIDGKSFKTYLIAIIDDASRLIVGYGFYLADNAINVQLTLKEAMLRYGIPRRIYADNGSPYKNMQLSLICARLGVTLIHAKVYHGNQKGKIERTFKSIKEGWMYNINYDDFNSTTSLNRSLAIFITHKNNTIHSVTKKIPLNSFLQDKNYITRKSERILHDAFMHSCERKVGNDAIVRINGESFETSQEYIGKRIELRYEPDMSHVYIFEKNKLIKEIFKVNRKDNAHIKRNAPLFSNQKGHK